MQATTENLRRYRVEIKVSDKNRPYISPEERLKEDKEFLKVLIDNTPTSKYLIAVYNALADNLDKYNEGMSLAHIARTVNIKQPVFSKAYLSLVRYGFIVKEEHTLKFPSMSIQDVVVLALKKYAHIEFESDSHLVMAWYLDRMEPDYDK